MAARLPRIVSVQPTEGELDAHARRQPRQQGLIQIAIALDGVRGGPIELQKMDYREARNLARDILAAIDMAEEADERANR